MAQLTQTYLESLGFLESRSQDHSYRCQFSRYDTDVTRGIILVSQTSMVSSFYGQADVKFDVWFWGQTRTGDYAEIDSHMSISSSEELETIISYLRD